MTKFKAGDKVRLIGEAYDRWDLVGQTGEIVTGGENATVYVTSKKMKLNVCPGWEVELIEEEKESTVAVKFEDVQVGDRARLTAANGDVAEFTAILASGDWLDSATNSYSKSHWEKVEILTRAQKPLVPGLYESNSKDLSLVVSTDGTVYTASAKGSWEKVMEDRARHLVEYGGMELTFAF